MTQSKKYQAKARARAKVIFRVVIAAVITACAGSVMSTQFVIAGISTSGAAVPFSDRAVMSLQDILGLAPFYAVFISISFAIAFCAAWRLSRAWPHLRLPLFIGAGAVSMLVMLLAMEKVFFGIPIIGGARTPFGLAMQMLCGGLGGYIFARRKAIKGPRETLSHDDLLPT